MPRVGSLDNPAYIGKRSVAVYRNDAGFFTMIDGACKKLHGATRWTKLDGTRMRGATTYTFQTFAEEIPDEDEELQRAIAASLESVPNTEATADNNQRPNEQNNNIRECSICLTEPICMLMKPCNHCCACASCARRLLRQPCPICRVHVVTTERIYF